MVLFLSLFSEKTLHLWNKFRIYRVVDSFFFKFMAKVLLSKKNLIFAALWWIRSIRIFRIGVGICGWTVAFKHCMVPPEVCFNKNIQHEVFHSQMSAVLIARIDVILNFQTLSRKQKSSG